MIYINCPNCEAELELDEGFLGGVCRCSDCKTLMLVPDREAAGLEAPPRAAAPGQRPDAPSRPNRPSAPTARPDRPSAPSARPEAPRAATPAEVTADSDSDADSDEAVEYEYEYESDTESEDGRDERIVLRGEAIDGQGPGTFTTGSGRTVTLTAEDIARAPVLKKHRMGVRLTVIGLFILLIIGLSAPVGFAMWFLLQKKQPQDYQQTWLDVMGDIKNPYTFKEPNIMGLPVPKTGGERLVIMIDGSQTMNPLFPYVREALQASIPSLAKAGRPYEVQVIVTGRAPMIYPTNPVAVDKLDTRRLGDELEQCVPRGQVDFGPAVEIMMNNRPHRLIYIGSFNPKMIIGMDMNKLLQDQLLNKLSRSGVKLHTIWVGKTDFDTPQALVDYQTTQEGENYKPLFIREGRMIEWQTNQ